MSARRIRPIKITEGHEILLNAANSRIGRVDSGNYYESRIYDVRTGRLTDNEGKTVSVSDFLDEHSSDIIMVPVYMFGCADLYVPVKGSAFFHAYSNYLVRSGDIDEPESSENRSDDHRTGDDPTIVIISGKHPNDSPLSIASGIRVDPIYGAYETINGILDRIWTTTGFRGILTLYAQYQIIGALNQLFIDNNCDQSAIFSIAKLGCTSDEFDDHYGEYDEAFIDELLKSYEEIDFNAIFDEVVAYPSYDYINLPVITGVHNEFRMSKTPEIAGGVGSNYGHIYARISGTNVWQKLTVADCASLYKIEELTIRYSKTDKPRAFDKVYYNTEFFASSLSEILKLAVTISMDLDLNKIPEDKVYDYRGYRPMEEAITIELRQLESTASVTLTQNELGIADYQNTVTEKLSRNLPHVSPTNRYRNNFCLIDLIVDIANLHVSMNGRYYERENFLYY